MLLWASVAVLVALLPPTFHAANTKDHRRFYALFDRSATVAQLRRRFRQLSLDFHPDKAKVQSHLLRCA